MSDLPSTSASPVEQAIPATPATVDSGSPVTPATAMVAAAPQNEEIDIEQFAKIQLRVARIESVEAVPKSKKLLKIQVDLGPLGKRQILSGIAQFHTPESLIGRKIIVVANLKPAKMMGLESQGMLLAASSEDNSILSILAPSIDVPEGSRVR